MEYRSVGLYGAFEQSQRIPRSSAGSYPARPQSRTSTLSLDNRIYALWRIDALQWG
jgi:hypothetical protein